MKYVHAYVTTRRSKMQEKPMVEKEKMQRWKTQKTTVSDESTGT